MNQSANVWGITEYEGAGLNCPLIPVHLPWYKKIVLVFFRFGLCPMCIILSLAYTIGKAFRQLVKHNSLVAGNGGWRAETEGKL